MKYLNEMTDEEKMRPTFEIDQMKAGELFHHMLINFNPNAWDAGYYAQNQDYMEAFHRLNKLEIPE